MNQDLIRKRTQEVSASQSIQYSFEFGKHWSRQKILRLITEASRVLDNNRRVEYILRRFVRAQTPYILESDLPALPQNTVRVRFDTLDCITFVCTVNALAYSRSFAGFLHNLRTIRYRNGFVSNTTLLHYTENTVEQMIRCGMVRNITSQLLADHLLVKRTVRLGVMKHGTDFLTVRCPGDDNLGQIVSMKYIQSSRCLPLEPQLSAGDTILFVAADLPGESPGIVSHAGFVYKIRDSRCAYFVHLSPTKIAQANPAMAGVRICTKCDSKRQVLHDIKTYRRLSDYLVEKLSTFAGIIVLRPQTPPHLGDVV